MFQLLAQTYQTNLSSSSSAISVVFVIIAILVLLTIAVTEIVGMSKVLQKGGRPGWAAIIPIYGSWVLFEMAGKPGWWSLLALSGIIPVIGYVGGIAFLVLEIIAFIELARRFGKSTAFGVFGLVIFSFVGFPLLGFGDAKYNGAVAVPTTPHNPEPPVAPTPPTNPTPPVTMS